MGYCAFSHRLKFGRILAALFFAQVFSQEGLSSIKAGPISSALGGAGVASMDPLEGGRLNPAILPYISKYYMGLNYSAYEASEGSARSQRGLTLVDGKPDNVIPGSLSYSELRTLTSTEPIEEKLIEVAFGRFMSAGLAFGFKVINVNQSQSGSESKNLFNMGFGFLFAPQPRVSVGLRLENLFGEMDTYDEFAHNPEATVGLLYQFNSFFRGRFDVAHERQGDQVLSRFMTGFESWPMAEWPFRIGVQRVHNTDRWLYSVGTGWNGPRLSFDYGIQMEPSPAYAIEHLVDFKLHF